MWHERERSVTDVDVITGEGVLAYVLRGNELPASTSFITPNELDLQVGHVVRSAGDEISRHRHPPRRSEGTSEFLLIRQGHCEVALFDDSDNVVARPTLQEGDAILIVRGGHALTATERVVILEIRHGPHDEGTSKEPF